MKKRKNSIRERTAKIIIAFVFGIVLYISVSFLFSLFPFAETEKYPRPKNIILIVVDALRADRLGFMGYGRSTSPSLDSYAQKGFIFTNFYSQSGWTMPSVASFFTGMLPAFHRVENYQDVLSDGEITLAEMLRSRGYKTIGLSANSIISKEAGFAQGFDLWKNIDFDDCIVRRAVSYLDPSVPTPEELDSDNMFDYSGFRYMCIEKHRVHGIQPGYFDRGRYELRPEDFEAGEELPLAASLKEVEPGRYRWGFSLKCESKVSSVEMIIQKKNGDKKPEILVKKSFNAGAEWKMFSSELNLEKKAIVQLVMTVTFDKKNSRQSLYLDTPYLLPAAEKKRENVFLYLHLMEVHEPNKISKYLEKRYLGIFNDDLLNEGDVLYPPSDPYHLTDCRVLFPRWKEESGSLNWHNNRYDETIRFIDDQAGIIIDSLKKTNEYDGSLVIFTADHGQEFFDHGWTGHGYSVYNELIHIPMLMVFPRLMMDGKEKEIRQNAQAIDLFPTLDVLTGDGDSSTHKMGRNLLPLMIGRNPDWSESPIFSSDIRNRLDSIILSGSKYIKKESVCLSAELLFDNIRDNNERNPLERNISAAERIENFRHIREKHGRLVKAYQMEKERKTLLPEKLNIDKLAQLGYINPHYVTEVDQDIDCSMAELKLILLFLDLFGAR